MSWTEDLPRTKTFFVQKHTNDCSSIKCSARYHLHWLQDFAIFSPLYHMVLGVNATTTNYPFLQLLNRAQLAVSSVCGYINNLLN